MKQWEFQDKNIKQSTISSNMKQVKRAQILGAMSPT